MHVTPAKAGPDLRCVPGWRRFASGNAAHCKIADPSLRKTCHPNPDRLIASLWGNPFAADAPTNSHLDQPQPHAFPIGSTQPPRPPPWEVFQRGPTQAQPPPSRRGPHRKTFTKPVVLVTPLDRPLCAYAGRSDRLCIVTKADLTDDHAIHVARACRIAVLPAGSPLIAISVHFTGIVLALGWPSTGDREKGTDAQHSSDYWRPYFLKVVFQSAARASSVSLAVPRSPVT